MYPRAPWRIELLLELNMCVGRGEADAKWSKQEFSDFLTIVRAWSKELYTVSPHHEQCGKWVVWCGLVSHTLYSSGYIGNVQYRHVKIMAWEIGMPWTFETC